MDFNSIIQQIESYIIERGGYYSGWYVGIASDPKDRLFNDHNVNQQNDPWIYRQADSENIARDVEKYFVYQRKTDGAPGGGDATTKYVYAYQKSSHTKP